MLYFTLDLDTKIRIGDNIQVSLSRIDNGGEVARLAIDAPRNISVDRLEIYLKKKINFKPKEK